MLRDVPHLKAFLALGFGGMVVAVAIGTWVYPCFRGRCSEARTEATRYVWGEMYGISDGSVSTVVRTGGELTGEMARTAGRPLPQSVPGPRAVLNSAAPDAKPGTATADPTPPDAP